MTADIVYKHFHNLTAQQRDQFDALGSLYKEWNDKINVVSRKDIEQIYLHHVLHSLGIAKWTEFPAASHVLDFGTGGGFPGIPLAVFFPHVNFHLVDSIGKKIKVVEAVCKALDLKNLKASHVRVEDLKGKYDFITCRAVAPLKQIYDWTKHLVQKRLPHPHAGEWILLKGGDLTDEIKESGRTVRTFPLTDFFRDDYFNDKFIVSMR